MAAESIKGNVVEYINITSYDTSNFQVYSILLIRYNKLRILQVEILPKAAGTWKQLCVLPSSGDYPPATVTANIGGYGVTTNGEVIVKSDGNVQVNISGTQRCKANVIWCV